MSSEVPRSGPAGAAAPESGALLLCRAVPDSVAPVAHLLRERLLLTDAGADWSVLVPGGGPWRHGDEPVDRVLTGWATALAVGAPWPVFALWWDADRAGYTLASGFRRPVGYVWLANGTPAGEDEAMRTFAARLGLDPVLDLQSLERLTESDPAADARARLCALLVVLTRAGVALPEGLAPGSPTDRLCEAARSAADARVVEWPGRREALRAELTDPDVSDSSRFDPWMPWSGTSRSRALTLAQLATGLPVMVWGVRRRSGGWFAAGVLLLAQGMVGVAYELMRPRD